MTQKIYPYLVQTMPGQPITMRLSDGIVTPVSIECLRRLMVDATRIYAEETRMLFLGPTRKTAAASLNQGEMKR